MTDVGEAVRGLKFYRDAEVRWDHQVEIRARYGYRDFAEARVQLGLLRWLYARAWVAAERPSMLFDLAAANPWGRGSVGPSGKRRANQVAMAGWKSPRRCSAGGSRGEVQHRLRRTHGVDSDSGTG